LKEQKLQAQPLLNQQKNYRQKQLFHLLFIHPASIMTLAQNINHLQPAT
jgi:hypothetical protein